MRDDFSRAIVSDLCKATAFVASVLLVSFIALVTLDALGYGP